MCYTLVRYEVIIMLNLTATSLFDGTLAAFLVVFTLLLILITKNNIRKRLM